MLIHVFIRNFAIVDQLSLDFGPGLCVLTGETGAGKSIIVDAITLALGGRADSTFIRHGEERCEISLCFDVNHILHATAFLAEHQMESDGECILRRIINRNGSSRNTINGIPCTLTMMREFSQLILNIHGQHQHQLLTQMHYQGQQLDNFAGSAELLKQTKDDHQQWQQLEKQIEKLQSQHNQRDEQLSLLRYQLNELQALHCQADEWQQLSAQHQQLYHAQDTIRYLNEALQAISEDNSSASIRIELASSCLKSIKISSETLTNIQSFLDTATIQLEEARIEIQAYLSQFNLNSNDLATIEQRLSTMHDLARKHKVKPEALFKVQAQLEKEITQLNNMDQTLKQLKTEQQGVIDNYQKTSKKLTAKRKRAAKILNTEISERIQQLNIVGGQFSVEFLAQNNEIHPLGNEKVQFMVSTNPGQPLQAIQKIASGGGTVSNQFGTASKHRTKRQYSYVNFR